MTYPCPSPTSRRRNYPKAQASGFALITTLLFLAILLGLIVLLASSVGLKQRKASIDRHAYSAQQSALSGLKIAMGELQAMAGPDQRITANASILGDSGNPHAGTTTPSVGREAWTGVWKSNTVDAPNGDTAQYSPDAPNDKTFTGWLVSATDSNGDFTLPTSFADTDAANDDVQANAAGFALRDVITLFTNADANSTPYLQAGKVHLDDVPGGKRYFAFAVEDEGLKADLSWNELPPSATIAERAQSSRLSAAPGPDYTILNGSNGPFGTFSYPLTLDDSTNTLLTDAIEPMRDPADLQTSLGADPDWLKNQRADITWGSRGVLADVKKGGLRRDLSLAFEMDGEADVSATEQPDKFNDQEGEFVGGSDHLTAPQAAAGMDEEERFLYQVRKNDGSPFSSQLKRADSVIRGPNWYALRDYYNLYKRLEGTSGDYTLNSRAYYPNASADPTIDPWSQQTLYDMSAMAGGNSGANLWDYEYNANNPMRSADDYVYKPAAANYAPILLGLTTSLSAKVAEVDDTTKKAVLAMSIDPFFYLWNPYNVDLHVPKYVVKLNRGFGGKVTFRILKQGLDPSGNQVSKTYGPTKIDRYVLAHVRDESSVAVHNYTEALTYLVSDLTMAPGEVVVVSPGAATDTSANPFHDEATPGTNTTNSSGITIKRIPLTASTSEKVELDFTDTIQCLYTTQYGQNNPDDTWLTNSAEHFWIETRLPDSGNAGSMRYDLDMGDELQHIGGNLAGGGNNGGMEEYFEPVRGANYPSASWPSVTADVLRGGGKYFFGINAFLLKPSNYTKIDGTPMPNQNPVEIFSQFNPFRMVTTTEMWRPCVLNEVFCAISKTGNLNTYIQEVGIQFPPGDNRTGYWGQNFHGTGGSQYISQVNIPSNPLLSLADFSNANLSLRSSEPFKATANSRASVFVPGNSLYDNPGGWTGGAADSSWLINDALFDRYFLSGIAPDFTITSSGYAREPNGTTTDDGIEGALTKFFSASPQDAQANPILHPYLPPGTTAADAINTLSADDGYKKAAAYSLIDGSFNVNSTSVMAWESLLRSNRNLTIQDAEGGADSGAGSPFPNGTTPTPTTGNSFTGFSRLTDAQITTLATDIVAQVKARGPFMSLSDFVNRQVSSNSALNTAGALQAALDTSDPMNTVKSAAGGTTPVLPSTIVNDGSGNPLMPGDATLTSKLTTEGIASDITQADLLRPLAPRLTARSDTFRVRAYGEVRSNNGSKVLSRATCEAVVQRVPEYLDEVADDPWNEGSSIQSAINQQFGRRFKVVQLRWLAPDEV